MRKILLTLAAAAVFSVAAFAQTTVSLSFHKTANDGSPRFVWPFSNPSRCPLEAKLAEITFGGQPQTFTLINPDGSQYSFVALGANGLLSNSMGGLLICGESGNYLSLPAVPGKKLTKIKLTTGNASKYTEYYTVTDADGSAIGGIGAHGAFEVGAELEFNIPEAKENHSYKLTNVKGNRMAILSLTLIYE